MKSFNFLYQKREHKLIHIDEMYHKSKTEQSNKDNSDRNIQRITKAYNFTKIALLFSLWQGELINKLSHISANVEKISLHCCSVMARICCSKWHFCHSFVIQYIYIYIVKKRKKDLESSTYKGSSSRKIGHSKNQNLLYTSWYIAFSWFKMKLMIS